MSQVQGIWVHLPQDMLWQLFAFIFHHILWFGLVSICLFLCRAFLLTGGLAKEGPISN